MASIPTRRSYPIAESKPVVEAPPAAQDWESHRGDTIIIDNGSSTLRAGWSSEDTPRVIIDNVGSKYRDRKTNKMINLAGSESFVDATSRAFIKSPFEADVVCNFDQMESMLDYVFYKLGIQSDTVSHPILISETLCNPHYSRSLMSELLFEGYNVPSITYGVDSLYSFYENSPTPTADGLIISSATASTHVIPVLNGQGILASAKRLAWGGSHAAEYLLKLMQLKYPTFPGRLSSFQSASMYREHCYYASDYTSEIRALSDSRSLAAADRVIQFPFVPLVIDEKTEEDLARTAEKKKEAGRRLQEQAVRLRLEKLVRQEEESAVFTELRASKGIGRKVDYEKRLKAAGFTTTEDLDEYLKKIEKSLQKARNKELGVDENEGKEPPTFPLVDVPDHTLNEEDLKEKRRQRLMKAGYDARIRAKVERDADKAREAEEQKVDEESRRTDMAGWLRNARREHEDVIVKMKDRKKRKEQLSDRKSLAAQNRMKSIANLASDVKPGKKRKRGDKEDDFGKNDDDWAVYREIGNADDSDEDEDEQSHLRAVELRLLEYDPTFTIDHTAERLALRKHQLLNAFVRGLSPDDPLNTYDLESLEHNSQLHLNVERVRVPEVIWQPHLGGLDQAGLAEIVEHVLKGFSQSERDRLTANIFVTGGNTLIPNFDLRLQNCLRPVLSVDSTLKIVRPSDIFLDSWKGMAKWSRTEDCRKSMITRAEYEVQGGDWIKAHGLGNP